MSITLRLARAFCRHLTDDVVTAGGDMAAIVAANAAETDASVCHSHDVVDANESLLDAFQEVFGCHPCAADEIDQRVINAAWDFSKLHGFAIPEGPEACPHCQGDSCGLED